MIPIDEADALIRQYAVPRDSARVPLSDALGLVLAEEITSHSDSPPFDKSMVDGFAVAVEDVHRGCTELEVLEDVVAGKTPTQRVVCGTATRIMTGAPIPKGAQAVVMVEDTELIQSRDGPPRIRNRNLSVRAGQNIMPRGASVRQGDRVLTAGCLLRPLEIGLLAEFGVTTVAAFPRARVAVLATGNELVPADSHLAAGQIRNSNGPMLCALVHDAGGVAIDLGIGRDDQAELAQRMRVGLSSDVLLVSGGVSAGILDLVPEALQRLAVRAIFHKVKLKPGKPLWFGVLPSDRGHKLVFGLPGNPVSTFVCFQLFVRPALAALAGRPAPETAEQYARLVTDFHHRSDRPTFFPARLRVGRSDLEVEPLLWKGSADLRTVSDAACLICLPAGEQHYATGDVVAVVMF